MSTLSRREQEVLEKIYEGLTNKEIAEQLSVEEKTIKFHTTHIYDKKGVNSRSQLMARRINELKRLEHMESALNAINRACSGLWEKNYIINAIRDYARQALGEK